ncbi:MAG: adenylate/guanylate cyclase domain-containing protein [Candidatus Didemnitutus sp.]|nr:adenylate/guanylate cyclase domain-containing protein [Candidatus Didemnitutus sp.]
MTNWFRFRHFRTRLLVLIVGLVAALQVATFVIVSNANRTNALTTIDDALHRASRQFQVSADRREEALLLAARLMANDYAMKQLFLMEEFSGPTARSALTSYQGRIQAPLILLLDPTGDVLAGTRSMISSADLAPFHALIATAENADAQQASGYGYFDGELHQIVLVPLLAPPPIVVAWVGIGFPINAVTAAELKASADVEVTFLSSGADAKILASTMPVALADELARQDPNPATRLMHLQKEDYVTAIRILPLEGAEPARIALQRSLRVQLAPSRLLEQTIIYDTIIGLVIAILAALGLARNVSRPVQQLAAHTQHVAAGDYTRQLDLRRADEFGALAHAFNHMTTGLAERDRVRDLLGKVVSPEIATQLLQSDLQLGGEVREVTVLFSDLRDFTALSEKLPPTELLALLNRYLDRMSAVVEKHHGVIDKYIGDAVMALFGAPVAQADSAARAVAAAREMAVALVVLNRELAAEGKPTLALGIGISTGQVIAGNMGSKTRLNYTVVGDSVNLAARLEALTKDPAYATRIIVSAHTAAATRETLRPLGGVVVKGKTESVQIFAVDA